MAKEKVKRKIEEERLYIKLIPHPSKISEFKEFKATYLIAVRVV